VVALVSPLDAISDWLFSAHMIQHELLMVVAAPLIAASAPITAAVWLFGTRLRAPRYGGQAPDAARYGGQAPDAARYGGQAPDAARYGGQTLRTSRTYRTYGTFFTEPAFVWILHALALWVWHVPVLFQAAMAHESIHVIQHFCFFTSACLFWWGMAHGRYGRLGYGAAVIYIFATAVHSGVLGALLTFAPSIWYPVYSATTYAWGFTPLEDQQLAGLIMWVPASLIFLAGGLAFLAAWIRESDRRQWALGVRR
jgi:putative membrane protein